MRTSLCENFSGLLQRFVLRNSEAIRRNNKFIVYIILFASLCQFAGGQVNSFSREWAFGVNGGANLSRMRFNSKYYVPQGLYVQPAGGLTVRYISENHFGIVGELNYSLCGWTEKKDTLNGAHLNEYTRSLAYLEIPLLTHIYFSMGKRARLIFNAGPQIRYNIGEEVKKRIIGDENTNWIYYDDKYKVTRQFDYGIKGTAGVEIQAGIGSFILGGSYYFGLADIFNNGRADVFQASSNQIISVNLTYLITRFR
ncbi:MAG: PorT family protein [Dysgonamonadaceae bacterium]|jgi:hypothetical protein|nr:PorT family protein [Dysgonamonadaceae bacterium]